MLPRYCGIMYRIKSLKLDSLPNFFDTLHLYAAPYMQAAAAKEVKFVNKPLLIFNNPEKSDGAWADQEKILLGLEKFLINCKFIMSSKSFKKIAKTFFENYFSEQSDMFDNKKNGLYFYDNFNCFFDKMNT